MWSCEHCGETVDEDDFEVCWRCSSPRVVHEAQPEVPPRVVGELADDGRIAVFLAIGRGVGTIVAHPIILAATVPTLLWHLAATVFGPSAVGFFGHPTSLDWRTFIALLPHVLVLGPVSTGLVTLLVYAAAKGSISVTEAVSILVRRFPALLVTSALVVPFFVSVGAFSPRFAFLPMCVVFYVEVRLTFWAAAILVDGLGPLAAARRAWVLAHGNWWRLCVLAGLTGIVDRVAKPFIPVPAAFLLSVLLAPLHEAIVTSAYLQRIGILPGRSPFPSTLRQEGAVAFPGS